MKNKKLLLLIVLAVLVAGSMVVEATIGDRIKTLTDGINLKGFAPIIVNTIILTVIIYFVLQLLGFKGGESNTSKVVVLLMIIIIAFIISKKTVVDDNGNNVYIWSAKGFVKGFLDIIKNPNSLYVFVGATLIFLWLFTFLKVGGDGFGSKLNVVMAILIGYSLATAKSPDLSKVVKMGEIVAIYIIYHNLKQSIKNEYAAIGGAAFLVFYISSVSFPDKGLISTIPGLILNTLFIVGQIVLIALIGFGSNLIGNRFEGKAAKLFSKLGSFVVGIVIVYGLSYLFNLIPYVAENAGMGIFTGKSWKTLFGVVAGIAVIIAVMAGMGKKDEEKKEKDKKARWKQDGISYGYHLFLNWAGRTKNPLVRFLYRLIDPKESAPSDQLHFGFRALRVEFMTMMNYLLRLQIFFSKRETMTAKLNKFNKKIYGTEGGLNYVPEIEKVMSNLILLKTGVDFIKGDDGKWKPGKGVEVIGDDNKASKVYAGFAQHEYLIYSLLNKLKENIESCKFADQSLQVQEQIKEDIAAELEPAMAGLESSKKKFGFNPDEPTSRAGYLERIGAYRTVEMWRIIILDWYRKHGRNNHTYL
ncbi:MAG: hypothetical protein KJ561_04315, partial [Nanoarchaeota archaeon]|nr:hypothetical protein [Nanoarchaeota archaeon]